MFLAAVLAACEGANPAYFGPYPQTVYDCFGDTPPEEPITFAIKMAPVVFLIIMALLKEPEGEQQTLGKALVQKFLLFAIVFMPPLYIFNLIYLVPVLIGKIVILGLLNRIKMFRIRYASTEGEINDIIKSGRK